MYVHEAESVMAAIEKILITRQPELIQYTIGDLCFAGLITPAYDMKRIVEVHEVCLEHFPSEDEARRYLKYKYHLWLQKTAQR